MVPATHWFGGAEGATNASRGPPAISTDSARISAATRTGALIAPTETGPRP